MRYCILICLLITITTHSAFAQPDTVTLNMKNVPIATVIEAIKKQTAYRFSYDIELETQLKEKKITINATRQRISQLLPVIFDLEGIAYKVVDHTILLSKKKSESEVIQSHKTLMQTVKGKVIDKESKVPLIGVNIFVIDGHPPLGAVSDINGLFSLKVPVGRHSLKFTYVSYEEFTASDLSVTSGKETQLNIEMRESVTQMNEVVVKADHDKDIPLNSMATVSARQITTEDASRYAAGYNDPARMVSAFAGVMTTNDSRNSIVIRGNSPLGLLWKLEGIEVPNPNHFNNGQGDGGGVFSIISSDVLANSDFFTGAFPGEYGNSTSGILDLNLRKGNGDKREYGIQIGMIGSQISLEGPLSKDHKVSYLFNYRYGSLQFLDKLGLLGLDENQEPPIFQDINFNIHFDTKKAGTFSLFGVGGMSSTGEVNPRDYQSEDHKMGVVGLKHTITWPNNKTFVKTIVSLTDQYDKLERGNLKNNEREMTDSSAYNYPAIRAATTINHKLNAQHTIRAGLIYSHLFFNIYEKQFDPLFIDVEGNQHLGTSKVTVDQSGTTGLVQAFCEWKYRVTNTFEINSGIHNTLFLLNHNYSIEPRLGLKWHASPKSSFSYGFGLHSKVEPISVYFSQVTNPDGTAATNENLELTKAMHHVIGYDLSIRQDMRIKIEAYYQYLYDVPVSTNPASTYSRINSQFGIPDFVLVNNGKGYNKGIEVTLEKFYSNNYYFLATGSLFDSKYKSANGETYNTYFNSKYQANLVAGKDFKVGKSAQNIFSINFKTLTRGGFRYTPQKIGTSDAGVIYLYTDAADTYTKQMPYYLRFDLGLKYRRNNPRYSWIISLDIQNLTNRQNVIDYESLITRSREIVLAPDTGIGIIPVLNFRVEF
ncbi:MAG TPA: carboxypeptidase-like regulatory domain-containing protein [Cyclobacteriaceae bacterium]